jgi:hypothetical protein
MRQPGGRRVQDRGQCAAHDGSDFSYAAQSELAHEVTPSNRRATIWRLRFTGMGRRPFHEAAGRAPGPEVSGQEPASAPPADPPRRWRPIRGARHGGGHLPSARSLAFATAPSWRTFAARVPRAVNATSSPNCGRQFSEKEVRHVERERLGPAVARRRWSSAARRCRLRAARQRPPHALAWRPVRGAWQTGQSRPVRRARAARRAPRARRGRRPHRGPGSLSLA